MASLLSFLASLGITPGTYPFIYLTVVILGASFFLNKSFGKKIKSLDETVQKVKTNIKVIVTFLATDRPRFDSNIIEAMSPLQIQEKGYDIIRSSGLDKMMGDSETRKKILACVEEQNPRTKLDVENTSIVCFGILMTKDFMAPIKTYLYNFPNVRDVFPTLVGLYIRNAYLNDHPEITE